ncbi:hypothetical protein D3C72_1497990 [compost metagenome]
MQADEVVHDGLVHQAGLAGPVRLRLLHHGDEGQRRIVALPLLHQPLLIEPVRLAHAPVEEHRALAAGIDQILQDGAGVGEAGATRHQDQGARRFVTQEGLARRQFDLDLPLLAHAGQHLTGVGVFRGGTDLQLQHTGAGRRVGDGEGALVRIAHHHQQILARLEAHRLLRRQGHVPDGVDIFAQFLYAALDTLHSCPCEGPARPASLMVSLFLWRPVGGQVSRAYPIRHGNTALLRRYGRQPGWVAQSRIFNSSQIPSIFCFTASSWTMG